MLLLGIDVGTSSIKVSVVDAATQKSIASAQYPEVESGIKSLQPGWAEQSPEMWWDHVQQAIKKVAHVSKLSYTSNQNFLKAKNLLPHKCSWAIHWVGSKFSNIYLYKR